MRRLARVLLAALLAVLVVTGAPARAADISEQVVPCTLCHGAEGRSAADGYYPRIAGKPAEYLFNQLVSFRDGKRQYTPMHRLLVGLDDAYLRAMAEYFGSQDLPYPTPQAPVATAAELEQGRRLVRSGDGDSLPACASCHGERLTGNIAAIPGLLGLPRDYINAQIGAWREGQRRSGADDCMAKVARALDPLQVRAVSNWLASQPVPAASHPSSELPSDVARECGVVARALLPVATGVRPAPAGPEASGDPLVARGAYLARVGNCASCHTRVGGAPWAGGRAIVTPFGKVYSSNLTGSADHGIGRWGFEDFRRAMREGVDPDGRLLSPAFPYTSFTRLHDDDLEALFAYLQTLAPVDAARRPAELRWPYSTQLALRLWRARYFKPGEWVHDGLRSPAWNRGAYLVHALAHCGECHSPRDRLGGQPDALALTGERLPDGWYAPDLRDAAQAGMSSVEDLVAILRTGHARSGWAAGPMVEVVARGTSHLTRDDAEAIAGYLLEGTRERPQAAGGPLPHRVVLERGERIYRDHCSDCHGEDGQASSGRAPVLAGNPGVRAARSDNLLRVILEGGYAAQTPARARPWGMPPYAAALSDSEIAAVATYIRYAWENHAGEVRASHVAAVRVSAQ